MPRSTSGRLATGLRVRVPFGRRLAVGVVVACAQQSELPLARLRPIDACLDEAPLPEDWQWLCHFAARYYQHSWATLSTRQCRCCCARARPCRSRT